MVEMLGVAGGGPAKCSGKGSHWSSSFRMFSCRAACCACGREDTGFGAASCSSSSARRACIDEMKGNIGSYPPGVLQPLSRESSVELWGALCLWLPQRG